MADANIRAVTSQPVRKAAKAGTWYPGEARALAAELDEYCAAVHERVAGEVLAIVSPHAGLVYSGPVAAHAYAQLTGRACDAIVLVGPSHYVAFRGAAIVRRGAFETPLGLLPIAEDLADAIVAASPLVHERPAAHDREHCLELQLPFLQRVLPGVPIVPIVMGRQDDETIRSLAQAIVTATHGRRVLLVASSDLSHYHDARTAAALDAVVVRAIDAFDADALGDALAVEPEHACGGGPILTVMRAAKALGARRAQVLCRQDSGDISGDTSAVVGYLAAAIGTFERIDLQRKAG
jgi:AmmeMemoRadiSam system protein B